MKRGTVTAGFLDGGQWSACFGMSYRDLCLYDATVGKQRLVRGGGTELRMVCGTGGIASGRNQVAAAFLDGTDSEWLWFVDTDMGFSPDTVDRLIDAADEHKRPVMGGLCFAQKADPDGGGEFYAPRFVITPTLYEYADIEGEVGFRPTERYEVDAVQKVAGTGAACVLIHRRVLKKMRAKYGDAWFDPITHPTGGKGGKPRTFSEDLSFCIRLAAIDEPVYVDTRVRTCHEKDGIYLDEYAYDRERTLAHLLEQQEAAGV